MDQRDVWNKLAYSWNNFRQRPLKELDYFSDYIIGKSLFIGCGNGRNFTSFPHAEIFGIDFSKEMILNAKEFSRRRGIRPRLAVGNENLPFKKKYFDSVLLLSSLHCMKNRREALSESKRVLKPGGNILISVWNKWQWRFFPRNIFTSEFFIKWRQKNKIYHRYYHLYSRKEIKSDVESFFKIEKIKVVGGNIFVLATNQ